MATQTNLNVSLTQRLMDMVRANVHSGRYQSASEVVRDALRLLEERDQQQTTFWKTVRGKVAEGEAELRAGRGIPSDVFRANMAAYAKQFKASRAARPVIARRKRS